MSQHLIDSGQRAPAGREHADRGAPHGDRGAGDAGDPRGSSDPRGPGGAGDETARHDRFGGSGHGNGDGRGDGDAGGEAHGTGAGDGRGGDPTLRALDALSDALAEMSADQQSLERRLRQLHRQRSEGRAWRDILAEEDAPGTMQVVSHMLACLARASGLLRKELVDSLRHEGASIPAIAKLFGVTHQRVSNLLRRPPE